MQFTFGFPDTLPPLTHRELRSCMVFASMGLLVLAIGLFPSLRPPPQLALPIALATLTIPAVALFRFLTGWKKMTPSRKEARSNGTNTQVGLFALIMIAIGIGFYLWANFLGVESAIILGILLIIEGLGGII